MSLYSRVGRPRPQGGGLELFLWYLMRVTGVGLFVLAFGHYLITHTVYDPADQTSSWIAEVRWSNIFWRAYDWLLLILVLFHAFVGVRTVVMDYARGGLRVLLLMGLYLLAGLLFVMGTVVVMTLQVVPKA